MTVCVCVLVWRMITQRLLPQKLHEAVLPSEKTAWLPPPRLQSWSSVAVCGVSVSTQLPATQPLTFVYCWLVVAVLPVWTPFANVVVVPLVRSCWMTACCLAVQPQFVGPPRVGKFATLLPWQSTCSDCVPLGVKVVLVEPVPSRVVVTARSTSVLPRRL